MVSSCRITALAKPRKYENPVEPHQQPDGFQAPGCRGQGAELLAARIEAELEVHRLGGSSALSSPGSPGSQCLAAGEGGFALLLYAGRRRVLPSDLPTSNS